ncbi:hypothetical protein F5Y08DRAFT_17062 [Xylaria arbuscula]|nr:hypothetical protein F5Y08DRAFT_17062 [Xylaria arbuscula]
MEYQTPTPSIQAAFAGDTGSLLPPPPPPPQQPSPSSQPQLQQQQQPPQQYQQPQQPPQKQYEEYQEYQYQQQYQPPQQQQSQQQQQQQDIIPESFVGTSMKTMKFAAEGSLREYASLQKEGAGVGDGRLRAQGGLAASDLRALRAEVLGVLKRAQAERWRKWLLGGLVAAIIPAVRKIFRRSSSSDDHHHVSSNDTEHAFRKSKSLIARILDSVHVSGSKSGFASIAFFVLAVLYVFQNEVSLRVARTVSKRLKTLVAKVETGVEDVGEQDLKLLNGWRWRVLLW